VVQSHGHLEKVLNDGRNGKGGSLTADGSYQHRHVVISRIIAGRERAKKQSLIHTLAAMPGDGEDGRKDQHW
jgi:hypothetical protein